MQATPGSQQSPDELFEHYMKGLESSLGDLEGRSVDALPKNLQKLQDLSAKIKTLNESSAFETPKEASERIKKLLKWKTQFCKNAANVGIRPTPPTTLSPAVTITPEIHHPSINEQLWKAAYKSQWDLVRSILEENEKVNVNIGLPSGGVHKETSVLWFAVNSKQWDLVELMLSKDAEVNASAGPAEGGDKGKNVLWIAAALHNWDLVALLLARDPKVDVNSGPEGGGTVIWLAALWGRWDLVAQMLARGAKVNVNTCGEMEKNKGRTLLWLAIAAQQWDLVELMLAKDAKADVSAQPAEGIDRGKTVIWLAALWGRWDLVALMLARDAKANVNTGPVEGVHKGRTLLWLAAAFMQWDLVYSMLRNGESPDVNAAPEQEPNGGKTVLWYAAIWKKWDLVKWMLEIDKNANVDAAPEEGGNKKKTVLWFAIASKQWELVEKMGKPTPPSLEKFCRIASKTNQLIQSQIKETIQKIPPKHRKSKTIVSQIADLNRGVEDIKTSIYRVKKKIKAYESITLETFQSILDKIAAAQEKCKTKLKDLGEMLKAFKKVPSEFITEVTEETLEKKGRIKLEKEERTKREIEQEIEQVKGKREQSLKDLIVQKIGNDHPSTEEIFQSFMLRYEREDNMAIGQLSANLAAPARASTETLLEMTPIDQLKPNKIRRIWEQNCSSIEEELSFKLGLLAQQSAAIREIESSFKMALGDVENIVSPYKENVEQFCRQVEERTGFQTRYPDDRPADETIRRLQDFSIEVIKRLQEAEGTWHIDAALTNWESTKIKLLEDLNERVEILKITFKKRIALLFDFLSENREAKSSVTSSSEESSSPTTSPRPESSHVAGKAEQPDASEQKIIMSSGTHILQIKEEILSVLDAFLESKVFPPGMTEHDMTNLRAMINGIDTLKSSDEFKKLLLALRYELSHGKGGHSHYSQKDDYQKIEGQTTHYTLAESTIKKRPQVKRSDLAKKALLIVKKWKNDL